MSTMSHFARISAGFGVLVFASGCAQGSTDLAKAQQLYGIAKGVALVAAATTPALAPTISGDLAKADAASADAEALTASANALLLVAAPSVKVIGN
jgi:hypothetical protein